MLRIVEERSEEKAGELPALLDEIAREGSPPDADASAGGGGGSLPGWPRRGAGRSGHRLVVRNGSARARQVTLGSGTVEVRAPRVNDRRVDEEGRRQRFTSAILPPYMRRSPKVAEVLPILYLRGLSTGDFQPALESLLGAEASGLSASSITRMTQEWEADYRAFCRHSLADRDYVYVWVDGIHLRVRLEEDRLCLLVMIGVRPDGTKELIALKDGYRESTESWASLLRSAQGRGMQAPALAVGDGALGFWASVGEVWPETREQRTPVGDRHRPHGPLRPGPLLRRRDGIPVLRSNRRLPVRLPAPGAQWRKPPGGGPPGRRAGLPRLEPPGRARREAWVTAARRESVRREGTDPAR